MTVGATTAATAGGLVLALASTSLVNLAYLHEHDAVGQLPRLSLSHPYRSLRALLTSRSWLAAFAMESGGFALYVVALALAPLALVQSVTAGGIGVLAIASARMRSARLTRREVLGAIVSVSGLLFLAISLTGGNQRDAPGLLAETGVWLGATGVVAALALTVGRLRIGGAAADAIAGGLLLSCGDISTKLATQGGVRIAFALTAIVGYVLGSSLLQIGYQRGAALTVAGIATLLATALPIAAGPVLLSETPPTGALGVLRVMAFFTVTVGAVLLARPHGGAAERAKSSRTASAPII